MPYYEDPRVNDQSLTTMLRRDAILQSLDMADEYDDWITGQIERAQPDLKTETLFHRAVNAFMKSGKTYRDATREWAKTSEETNRPASQAEVFSNLLGTRFYRLLILGMLARMMQAEIDSGNTSTVIHEVQQSAAACVAEQGAKLESELNYRALPIRSLVGVQVCAGLATAEYLRESGNH